MDNVDKDGRWQIVDMELRGLNGFCFLLHVASSKLISLCPVTKIAVNPLERMIEKIMTNQ